MALEFHIAESPCIIWRTYLPRVNYLYESQVFRRGSSHFKFRLDCKYNYDSELFSLSLKNCNQPKLNFEENLSVYVENNDGYRKLCYFGKVYNESSFASLKMPSLKSYYGIKGDTITFLFIFDMVHVREPTAEVAMPTQSTPLKSEIPRIQSSCLQTFSEDIKKLLGHKDYSDVVLKCSDTAFPVNKNILSARSEMFSAMFHNKSKDSQIEVVDIPNVNPLVMYQFLLYLYSGGVPELSMTTVLDLYQIGDMYAVPSLKQKCASFLADNLSEEVVCTVLQLAQHYKNEELLDIATSFVTTKVEFMKSETWITFAKNHPAIGLKVYLKLQTI